MALSTCRFTLIARTESSKLIIRTFQLGFCGSGFSTTPLGFSAQPLASIICRFGGSGACGVERRKADASAALGASRAAPRLLWRAWRAALEQGASRATPWHWSRAVATLRWNCSTCCDAFPGSLSYFIPV